MDTVDLQISERAVQRLKVLTDTNPDKHLRITVLGGGCSGFQYQFLLDTNRQPDDLVFEKEGTTVVIDTVSLDLIKGSELDYVEDLASALFVLKNPNATASCGCGNSFTL